MSETVSETSSSVTGESKHDFYVAGPFFNDAEVASMERLEASLEARGKTMFKPRFASDIDVEGPEACFRVDVAGIRDAGAVIANLIDDDPGTMFEIGYAYALGKPVYGYREGLKPDVTINLMIAQSVRTVFAGPEDLAHYLQTGEHEEVEYRQF